MKQVNEKAINGLYHSNKAYRAILNAVAGMPRQSETVLDTLENKLDGDVTRRDITGFFKLLEEYGAGEFIEGRRGHPSRFRWSVDSINVTTMDVPHVPQIHVEQPVRYQEQPAHVPTLIAHRYQLRADLAIALQLPSDLTPTEAHRLSQFIQSLPFTAA